MKYLIKRILSTCPWKKTNQNLASDIIFKLFHIYSLLGIINEMVLPETFLFPKREMLEQLKLILGETFVLCRKIIELGVYFIYINFMFFSFCMSDRN